ncbi:hypothetical protein [uncultured Marinobacter sp.]|uniref:hypothetical protein n=1 Tax=uncultured Marinobacter sp. TaxID=187379 RepID=UPI00258DF52C|nr:hypothetical protein [uncultured Marinobacter sp.]
MTEEIREKIDAARTKEQLEEIGRNLEPMIELDRRKNMNILQAELHAHLDQIEEAEEGQEPNQVDQGDESEAQEDQGDGDTQAETLNTNRNGKEQTKRSGKRKRKSDSQRAETQNVTSHVRKPEYEGRLLQNTKTKVFFPYTAALAKKRHMREV